MNAALPLQFFDRAPDLQIVERRLPHWSQAGTVCFITWRTVDSLPQPVLDQWFRARTEWLRAQQIDPEQPNWHKELKHLGHSNARGRFWQPDAFDHLIRSEEQFQYLRRYVADNPARIGLKSNECAHYSKQLA